LINITGGTDVTIKECQEIVEAVSSKLNEDAHVIWGAQISKELGDTIRALIIVTGVKTPLASTGEFFSKDKQNEIEKILGIEFV
jgi:cell division protein FtsZ